MSARVSSSAVSFIAGKNCRSWPSSTPRTSNGCSSATSGWVRPEIGPFSDALAAAFKLSPRSFVAGGISLLLATNLVSLGILSAQDKNYFEELLHLGTTSRPHQRESQTDTIGWIGTTPEASPEERPAGDITS